jgi:hypothetical protein
MKRRRRNPKVPTEDCVLLFKPTLISFDISTRREYRTRDRALIPLLPESNPQISGPQKYTVIIIKIREGRERWCSCVFLQLLFGRKGKGRRNEGRGKRLKNNGMGKRRWRGWHVSNRSDRSNGIFCVWVRASLFVFLSVRWPKQCSVQERGAVDFFISDSVHVSP